MIHTTYQVNSPVLLTLLNPSGLTGQPAPADLTLLQNGAVVTTPVVTVTDVGSKGLYNFSFTPQTTGTFVLYAYGAIQAQIEIVTKSIYTFMQNVEDESLGSWTWNKTAGTLTMLRQDGTQLATFAVVDNLTTASRERTG
jgi:hypothetical protein